MEPVPFVKYHGLGNDFLIVDLRRASEAHQWILDPKNVIAACDRQFGVGGDGVLAVLPPSSEGAIATMRVLNADGSEAEMCGNGIRCVALFLRDDANEFRDTYSIDTGAGLLHCTPQSQDGDRGWVRVDMGAPHFLRKEIPMSGNGDDKAEAVVVDVAGLPPQTTFRGISMGNPHAVAFVDNTASTMQLAQLVGSAVEHHPLFPKRVNVEFAQAKQHNVIDVTVWERGCGITLACGTGACATGVAACLAGHASVGQDIAVTLPGGTLIINVEPDYSKVWMTGPARRVFSATLDANDLSRAARPSNSAGPSAA